MLLVSNALKIVIIGKNKDILLKWYGSNRGNPVKTVIKGLDAFRVMQKKKHTHLKILRSVVTGYGEDLIETAFNMDKGIIETIAHYTAARHIDPGVSFILDIGGQDMKAIFIDNGAISRIEINEACSSGCGSFLETLAESLNYSIEEFARLACYAKRPCDLGTRCTVFMNSKIKQSLRENASIEEISAGLSYAVVKNCLFKVLKLHAMSDMGDRIILQGGTFKNPSIVRALELLTGQQVRYSDMPELMGAFGAALTALEDAKSDKTDRPSFPGLKSLAAMARYQTSQRHCKGCENQCAITRFVFPNGKSFYSGNKCEVCFSTKGKSLTPVFNFAAYKNRLIFDRNLSPHDQPRMTIGIPRCLNFYDNFVFWHILFTHCGCNVCLSDVSTVSMTEKGMGTVMSDNICFPAKLAHGHIYDLAKKGVDRIFYPIIVYEKKEYEDELNTYNCPIVSSYPDVIESAVNPQKRFSINLDRPVISFHEKMLLEKSCLKYLRSFGIGSSQIKKAIHAALHENERVKHIIREKGRQLIEKVDKKNSLLIVLAGRPYHCDPLINHKMPEMLAGLSADIITEDAVPKNENGLSDVHVLTQWSYPNRIYNAAEWVADQKRNIQMVQINSFGCGPDAIVIDEVKEILATGQKNHTLIKVDEISSPGSVRLRLRSMIESLKPGHAVQRHSNVNRKPFLRFSKQDRKRKIIVPYFAEDYSAYLPLIFNRSGYDFRILPRPDRRSVELGLQYASNDICYPGTIVIGDIIKALKSEKYHPGNVAVGITQTGGQCRASSYLSLIRKAMIGAGYDDIPILSVTTSQGMIDQPGFKINWLSKIKYLFVITMFADCIAKMYYATAPREKIMGLSQKIRQAYIKKVRPLILLKKYSDIFTLLKRATDDFNAIPINKRELSRMGVVGEIYAKYNYFANQNLVHWLIQQGIEPVIPPIVDYFIQDLVNYKENIRAGIRQRKWTDLLGYPIEWLINIYHRKFNQLFSNFKYGLPFDDIKHVAHKASQIVTMTSQFGEGWLVPGEIAMFASHKVNHVVSLQPFGCIANHVISKGVETKIKSVYPDMNIYHLDFDAGMSEANVRNRLHFMIEHLR